MKFVAYFELHPEFEPSELAEIGKDLMKRKLYPAEGYNSIAWYMVAGLWGISIAEADSVEAIMNDVNAWRIAKPGIFKTYKIEPATDTKGLIPIGVQLAKKVKG